MKYAPSIIPNHDEYRCWSCGRNGVRDPLNRHEVFHGAYRDKSAEMGLWVHLCHNRCHQGSKGVHCNHEFELQLQQEAQRCAMEYFGWSVDDFRNEFGKNYLED